MNVASLERALTPCLLRVALEDSCYRNSTSCGDKSYRRAAVMVVVYGNPPAVIMTVKPMYMKLHAGEISFPGGKSEDCDADMLDTALRETQEEINLHLEPIQIAGRLDIVTTLTTGFVIVPYVDILDDSPDVRPNSEVERMLAIAIGALLDSMLPDTDPDHNAVQGMYTFSYGDAQIWGASARILKQMHDMVVCKLVGGGEEDSTNGMRTGTRSPVI